MKRTIISILITVLSVLAVHAQDYKVIVNSANTESSISSKDLSNLFLKKKSKWSDGVKVVPVDQGAKSAVRVSFSSDIHGKSATAIKSYWQQYVFAGKGTPPVEKKSDEEVIAFVQSNPGAVGYVSAQADTSGVKVLTVN